MSWISIKPLVSVKIAPPISDEVLPAAFILHILPAVLPLMCIAPPFAALLPFISPPYVYILPFSTETAPPEPFGALLLLTEPPCIVNVPPFTNIPPPFAPLTSLSAILPPYITKLLPDLQFTAPKRAGSFSAEPFAPVILPVPMQSQSTNF